MQSLVTLMCFTPGVYEALVRLLNPVDKFIISLGCIMMILCSCEQHSSICFHTLQTHVSCPCLPLFSLLFLKNNKIKGGRNKSQKSFPNENKCMYREGTLKNKPNKIGTTPQHIYIILASCAALPTIMFCAC